MSSPGEGDTGSPSFPPLTDSTPVAVPVGAPRVAIVSDWFLPRVGGVELLIRDLALQLREQGIDAQVLTPIPGPPVREGVPVVHIPGLRMPFFKFLVSPRGVRRIRELLVSGDFDLVHAQASIICPTAWAGGAWGESLGCPTVVSFHSDLRWFRLPLLALDWLIGWRRWGCQFSAVSRAVAGEVDALLRGPPRVRAIPNATDAAYWAPCERLRPTCTCHIRSRPEIRTVRLISVMRLQPPKRPLALLRMVDHLRDRLPLGTDLELTLVGDGPQRTLVERAVRWRGLENTVRVLGRRSRAEIRDLHHASDIFVLPSFLESFGIAALEARASGLPVVAMGHGGVKDFITHEVNGLIAGNDQEMETHLLRLIRNPEDRASMARTNRTPPARWDWSHVLEEYLELYRAAGLSIPSEGSVEPKALA